MKVITPPNDPIVNYFQNVDRACRIKKPVPVRLPTGLGVIGICINRAYSGSSVARVCRGIGNNAVYTSGNFREQSVKQIMFNEVARFLIDVCNGSIKSKRDFDNRHNALCTSLVGNYQYTKSGKRGKGQVTYGIAQKLLNMALKYLFVEHNNGIVTIPNSAYDWFHCPIDGIVLKNLSFIYSGTHHFRGIRRVNGAYTYSGKTWSKMDRSSYLSLKDEIERVINSAPNGKFTPITPLELDFLIRNPNGSKELNPLIAGRLGINRNNSIKVLRGIVIV
ncbi:hypothetical protein C7457_1520 [Thermovibrio guaymasensis]|uniref:Uncharacterized protein n=1 Tax=Thermovibrio guaymasensis TaxID=240167 RepID=A0A420W5V5_9BACT|nr:hypothetical protein [Thermovibrio guaymasensis]RKQ60443.1 hypothetical protein C7457_1520 [Thermovibrio guaymasensis]